MTAKYILRSGRLKNNPDLYGVPDCHALLHMLVTTESDCDVGCV